jgi:hypothetical protein
MSTLLINQAMADKMVEQAISHCAEKSFGGDTQRTLQYLRQGRCDICGLVIDDLVVQIGEYLGRMDKTVKAVYKYGPEQMTNASRPDKRGPRKTGINLVAWADRKSAALEALGTTLESALSESRRKVGCRIATPACYTLDLQIVDDEDVHQRRGYGVVVDSLYLRSSKVWTRAGSRGRIAPDSFSRRDFRGDFTPFDLDLAPESLLLEHALAIEKMPAPERERHERHLQDIKTALIRRVISDQQAYIDISQKWLTISDLAEIHQRKIGYGRVGGKAAGMVLAARILNEIADEDVQASLHVPESYFLGSDLIYIFMAMNGLMHRNDQKYKPEEQIRAEYPQIQEEFQGGVFPPEVLVELRAVLEKVGDQPLIVRSSSQLEDNFGTSFAGKYDSYFCPNQGTPEENLKALTNAVTRTYASTLKPEALLYRRSKGLQDYDERMAVLLQVVQGEQFGKYYLPHAAGVAFSRNLYRWSPEIRREDGFVRLVWGLGTRAVGRVGDDYPRLVALSHPTLQPDDSPEAIRRYSQHYVDLIDLEENAFKTLPVHEVLTSAYPTLRYMAQLEQDGFFTTPRMRVTRDDIPRLAITFQALLQRTPFADLLLRILRTVEQHYHTAVDMEITLSIPNPRELQPRVEISLLQCRPQAHLRDIHAVQIPKDLKDENIVFSTNFMVPQGYLPGIRYVVFVKPEGYYRLPTQAARAELGALISQLNMALGEKNFICVGPGRWGSTNTDLGVFVSYADIHNAGALVELSGEGIGPAPEPSLGTHFFQDLMEAQIYPLALNLDEDGTIFNRDFFYNTSNHLGEFLAVDGTFEDTLRLIDVTAFRPGYHLEIIMDDEVRKAVAFLAPER